MQAKKFFGTVLACAAVISCLSVNAGAAYTAERGTQLSAVRATGRFNMEIPGETIVKADTSFPLEADETVTIKASYSPFSASVDFGLIAPDGLFYSVNATDGSIDKTIRVDERGHYTLAVRNNSLDTVSVSGYVNY